MSESKADTSAPVCVTGASGFLASELVKQLLERGYTVHGTVRSLKNPDKVDHLKKLKGADERLKLFEADLLKEESFKEPVKGCSCVRLFLSTLQCCPATNDCYCARYSTLRAPSTWKTLKILKRKCTLQPCRYAAFLCILCPQ